jgi:hypothetical protein
LFAIVLELGWFWLGYKWLILLSLLGLYLINCTEFSAWFTGLLVLEVPAAEKIFLSWKLKSKNSGETPFNLVFYEIELF